MSVIIHFIIENSLDDIDISDNYDNIVTKLT